jgi:hypothetical protein
MKDAERFLQHCRLTCLGGSEAGTCPCKGPLDCLEKDHPGFPAARDAAVQRMFNFMNQVNSPIVAVLAEIVGDKKK